MGIIIAKFRKKPTTYETLDKLENEIQRIEEFRRDTERTQKKMVGRFVFISVCVYCITAFIFYFYFFPASVYERLIYIIPLLILPILLMFVKRTLSWYYNRQITKNEGKLLSLRDEKKKIVEEVMDKETYKVAQKILEKFAPEQIRKSPIIQPLDRTPLRPSSSALVQQSEIRRRHIGHTPAPTPRPAIRTATFTATPFATSNPRISSNTFNSQSTPSQNLVPSITGISSPLQLPRGILPRERSVLDKMVDYLVGDGPSNRYALICKKCFSHNGMALKEEFDYLSFRCCYCGTFNPARKQRPVAPKLQMSDNLSKTITQSHVMPRDSDRSDSELEKDQTESADADSDDESSDEIPTPDISPIVTRGQSKKPDIQPLTECPETDSPRRSTLSEEETVRIIDCGVDSKDSSVNQSAEIDDSSKSREGLVLKDNMQDLETEDVGSTSKSKED